MHIPTLSPENWPLGQRFLTIEQKMAKQESEITELRRKVDFFVRSSLPPVEGIFYDGQIFEAYAHIIDDAVYLFGASLKVRKH